MAPPYGSKRKRGDRSYSQGGHDEGRPSPHRPDSLDLAQQSHNRQQHPHHDYREPSDRRYSRDGNNGNFPNRGGLDMGAYNRGGRGGPTSGGRGGHGMPPPARGGYGVVPQHRGGHIGQSNRGSYGPPSHIRGGHGMPPPVRGGHGVSPNSRSGHGSSPTSPLSPANSIPLPPRGSYSNAVPSPHKERRAESERENDKMNSHGGPPESTKSETTAYPFEYVTNERITQWAMFGRDSLIDVATRGTLEDLVIMFQELLIAGLTSRLDADEAGTMVRDIIAATSQGGHRVTSEEHYLFLDCLSAIPESDYTNPRLRVLVTATKTPSTIMRHALSFQLLLALGIVRDTFDRVGIRKTTNMLYRQSNYNLQREESEGYSKLMTELFSACGGDGTGPNDLQSQASLEPVVTKALERVKALIGTYDLDVGRVLDVTLDVFAAVLVKHYRFFVKFLRVSSWWPQASDESATHPRNSTAAQLLGFKLRFYTSVIRNEHDTLPANLIYLAALLIKIGFISLEDLYPHLWPADEDMETLKSLKAQERAENEKKSLPGGGAQNALAMAGALVDDTLPAAGGSRELDHRATATKPDPPADTNRTVDVIQEKEALPEPADQKVQLLKSLLCMGALPESLFILGRFPWLIDAFPELPEHLHRIIHHCLDKIYLPHRPLADRGGISAPKKIAAHDQVGVPKGQLRRVEIPARKVLRWPQIEKIDGNEGTDFLYYWLEWADNLPVCENIDDVFELCETLINYSGVKIGRDAMLLTKLTRIGKASLEDDRSQENEQRWIGLCKRLLVPALSLTRSNPAVVNEVFELLKTFRTEVRFSIYAEWNMGSISRLPDIKVASDRARAETKDILKRISKTNVKEKARALAKIACASPGVVFDVALGQIEAYDNLVEVVVECVRNTTKLGYDVLTWSLMRSLGGTKGRNRVQADGMLTSKWLSALSLFAGKVFRRYPEMDPKPVLQYVASQLEQGNPTDLIVLKELITSMAGIISDNNFTDSQLQAMAGGELLQAQTLQQLGDRRQAPEVRNSAQRLMKALSHIAGGLMVGILHQRQSCLLMMEGDDAHLKILGNLYDGIDEVFAQFLDLIQFSSGGAAPITIPSWSKLRSYGVPQQMVFILSRRSIMGENHDTEHGGTPESPASNPPYDPIYNWHPDYFRSGERPSFYVTFWLLSLSDMLVPTQSYEDEINRQKRGTLGKTASNELQDRLRTELKGQVHSFSQTRSRLQKEKDHWFDGTWGKWEGLNEAILNECFLPRLRLSPVDALYSFRMLKYLHSAGTPNFRTLGFIDILFREAQLTALVHVCTSREAANLGRFLNELLKDLRRWHESKGAYEKEATGAKRDLPGFAVKLVDDKVPETFLDYEDFRRVLLKWHKQLHGALKACLTDGEYMHIHNAIIVLNAVHTSFPAVNWIGDKQTQYLTAISKNDERNDLKLAATSLLGALKGQEKSWLMPQQFSAVGPLRSAIEAQPHTAKTENAKSEPEAEGGEDGEVSVEEESKNPPSKALAPESVPRRELRIATAASVTSDSVQRKEPRSTPAELLPSDTVQRREHRATPAVHLPPEPAPRKELRNTATAPPRADSAPRREPRANIGESPSSDTAPRREPRIITGESDLPDFAPRRELKIIAAAREPAPMAPHPDREALILDTRARSPPPRHDHLRSIPPRHDYPPLPRDFGHPPRDEGRRSYGGPPTGPRQDPNYGRLNPGPDVPSGPRSATTSSRNQRGPPTGPYTPSSASSLERGRGDRRMFAAVQNVVGPPRSRDDDRRRDR